MTNESKPETSGGPPVDCSAVYGAFRGSVPELEGVAGRLLESLEEIDLNRSEVLFGLEITRMETEVSASNSVVMFLLVLATMISKQRGSVRFGLGEEPDPLSERLKKYLTGLYSIFDEEDRLEVLGKYSSPDEFWTRLAGAIRDRFEASVPPSIVGSSGDETPFVLEDEQLYHQRSYAQERRLADSLARRLLPESPTDEPLKWVDRPEELRASLEKILRLSPYELSPRQQYGILTAACAPLSLVTGGPGTGKTSIVRSLVRLLVDRGVDPERIAIAAPTGKAANRLSESLQNTLDPEEHSVDRQIVDGLESASTLHRLLGYSPEWEDFYYHENRPMPYQYVIVDEASMIDLSLMDRLVSAVAEDSSLCLLGDADQLPAVESGAVFRDLVPERECTDVPWWELSREAIDEQQPQKPDPLARQAVRLRENFRVKGEGIGSVNLVKVAEAINDGGDDLRFVSEHGDDPFSVTVRSDYDQLSFEGVEMLNLPGLRDPSNDSGLKPAPLRRWYERWFTSEMFEQSGEEPPVPRRTFQLDTHDTAPDYSTLDPLFEAYNRAQLLSVTRRSSRGVRDVNRILHRYHRRNHRFVGTTNRQFLPGEPVIMTQNDYDRGLFNGEQGLVLRVDQPSFDDPVPMAVFPGLDGYRAYHLGPLRSRLEHAFALTVHKSQGSEYGCVGVLLPDYEVPLMTRELLYTAVTRARTSAVFFGNPETLRAGARARDERNSGLVERLQDKASVSTEVEPEGD